MNIINIKDQLLKNYNNNSKSNSRQYYSLAMPTPFSEKYYHQTSASLDYGKYFYLKFYSNLSLEELYKNLVITSKNIDDCLMISIDSKIKNQINIYIKLDELELSNAIQTYYHCLPTESFPEFFQRTHKLNITPEFEKAIKEWKEFIDINFYNKKVSFYIDTGDVAGDIINYQEGQSEYLVNPSPSLDYYLTNSDKYDVIEETSPDIIHDLEETQYLVI